LEEKRGLLRKGGPILLEPFLRSLPLVPRLAWSNAAPFFILI